METTKNSIIRITEHSTLSLNSINQDLECFYYEGVIETANDVVCFQETLSKLLDIYEESQLLLEGMQFGSEGDTFGLEGDTFGLEGDTFGLEGNTFGLEGNTFGSEGNTFGSEGNAFGSEGNTFPLSYL